MNRDWDMNEIIQRENEATLKIKGMTVNEIQRAFDRGDVTVDEIDKYIIAWNAGSHFTVLKRLGENLILLTKGDNR